MAKRTPKIFPGDGDPRHGTLNGYGNCVCRCEPCRSAKKVSKAVAPAPSFAGETCVIAGCDEPKWTAQDGWCMGHYSRARRHDGDPLGGYPSGGVRAWLRGRLPIRQDGCKVWPFSTSRQGYAQFWDGEAQTMRNAHAVACEERWGPAPSPGMEAAHGPCHDRSCFNGDHVSWKFPVDNARDKVRDGTLLFGESQPNSKLTDAQVLRLRRAYFEDGRLVAELAREVSMSRTAVRRAILGVTWAHLPVPGSLRVERPLIE